MTSVAPFSLPHLLSDFPVLSASLRGIERAAASDAPVLLLGEPGCGRSILARAIHGASRRAAGPRIEMDPGAVPSTLFESELFGYRAGAFTGADQPHDGRVAQADGGSLVLDHVEELPLPAQPKLLRLIAERRYAPLGGREKTVDLRFLAIGPEDLRQRVEGGSFRPDLFFRLEVLTFRLPPLRERRDELPKIVELLLADLALRFGMTPPLLAPRAASWMAEHTWPGNLRQLRNVLERALILGGTGAGAPLDPEPERRVGEERPRTLLELELEAIRGALAYTRGHQSAAADLLGISRKALWEKRKRHGIP